MPYDDDTFDLIYAFSVLTHLPIDAQHEWMDELVRTLRPGGILMITHHGDTSAGILEGTNRARYDDGLPVTIRSSLEGTNGCAAFVPPRYVQSKLMEALADVRMVPGDQVPGMGGQDLYVGRRPAITAR